MKEQFGYKRTGGRASKQIKERANQLNLPKKIKYNKVNSVSDEEFITLFNSSKNMTDFGKKLGYKSGGYSHWENIKKRIYKLNLSYLYPTRSSKPKYCLYCNKLLPKSKSYKRNYCSQKCYFDFNNKKYISDWKSGKISGLIKNFTVSKYIRNYLFKKYNNECVECGWNKKNKYTNKIPLQIHHIDGNYKNNEEDNLILLCPNCHSLTENYGSRNKDGKVRPRKNKYR